MVQRQKNRGAAESKRRKVQQAAVVDVGDAKGHAYAFARSICPTDAPGASGLQRRLGGVSRGCASPPALSATASKSERP